MLTPPGPQARPDICYGIGDAGAALARQRGLVRFGAGAMLTPSGPV